VRAGQVVVEIRGRVDDPAVNEAHASPSEAAFDEATPLLCQAGGRVARTAHGSWPPYDRDFEHGFKSGPATNCSEPVECAWG
jgi:hypothetical protein